MLRKLIPCLILVSVFFFFPAKIESIYDPLSVANNRVGVHILETAELSNAAELVNGGGGDWGYVTIPIRANDRDLPKWTKFMQESKRLHLIPILRIASFPVDDHWMAPNEYDLIDFANFLDELPWPTRNRYVIIYNEPNHKNEWGGFVYPQEYARVLDRAIDIFHQTNQDFFVISAGFDSSAPDSNDSLNEYSYLEIMNETIPGIFNKIDGFSTHSYGNPGFSSYPSIYSSVSVANYHFEENFLATLKVKNPKIFITEAGWKSDVIGDFATTKYFTLAFQNIWTDDNIVAITPFVLNAPAGPFSAFSLMSPNGKFKEQAEAIKNLPKTGGKPIQSDNPKTNIQITPANSSKSEAKKDNNLLVSLFQKIISLIHF